MIHLKDAALSATAGSARRRPLEERNFNWAASGWAGLIAGVLYIVLDSLLITLFTGGASLDVVRRIAEIALRQSAPPPRTAFTVLVFFAAMVVHLPLSLLYARGIAAVVQGMSEPRAVAFGAALGAGLYGVNYYVFVRLFPWFADGRSWIALISHVAFGATAAWVYVALTPLARTRHGVAFGR
jgi:hypothetical protein